MATGTVKYFNTAKGFGFIKDDSIADTEYFVHATGLTSKTIREGDKVSFDLADGKKGPNAVNVKVV